MIFTYYGLFNYSFFKLGLKRSLLNVLFYANVVIHFSALQGEDVAALVLGKPLFVNWPHLMEARVVAVSDGETQ